MQNVFTIEHLKHVQIGVHGMKDMYTTSLKKGQEELEKKNEKIALLTTGHEVVVDAVILCQQKARTIIEGIVTTALQTVYGDNYSFRLDYEIKRNQAEATPMLIYRDRELSLKDEVGGGIVDVVSFAFRLSLWSLTTPRTEPVFLLDEPFKFVSKDRVENVGEMLKHLSEMLGIQLILVTHEGALAETADATWVVSQEEGSSSVVKVG